ncbi:MAG: hypothetical protein ABEJ57_07080 [Halobacteriaceae archaeon]
MGEGYRGVLGAFPFAWRVGTSWWFRGYVLVAAAVTVLVAVVVGAGVVRLVAGTGAGGGVNAFVRAFYIVLGTAVLAPVLTPVLVVARRHRRSGGVAPAAERLLAVAGLVFLGLVYLGLVASTPAANQRSVTGVLAPVIAALYGLPRIAGVVFPLVGVVVVVLAVRLTAES